MRHRTLCGLILAAGLCSTAARAANPSPGPQAGPIAPETWQNAPQSPLAPGEIDRLIGQELQRLSIKPAPLTTDEQFLRRVTLDLTGRLPLPADVDEFTADQDPQKRAKLIDRLLTSDEFARHWAVYWREVISARVQNFQGRILARAFENWMTEQIKENKSWAETVEAILTAQGQARFDGQNQNGAAFFLLSRQGNDAIVERTAETSRVFLGIQIQCAQCHDHPLDVWKRQQFHELAGYFARLRERPIFENRRIAGFELSSQRFGEHRMPDIDNPRSGTTVQPRFLDGQAAANNLGDRERRQALARLVTDKNNHWFAAAYVNRMWGELMGQAFYQPVDDLGPLKEATLGTVLARVGGSFRATNYDTRELFRAILNSQAYQRQVRIGEATDEHLRFAASYPKRLNAEALWQSLTNVLGQMAPPGGGPPRGFGGGFGGRGGSLEGQFKAEFEFDPSAKADEIEGTVPQALLLMNNPTIQQRIKAEGTNLLGRILSAYPEDGEALRMLYLRTLARKPTTREKEKGLAFVQKVGNRTEAFEDLLWALINSTEFQTKR
jgi:hypothetical protein